MKSRSVRTLAVLASAGLIVGAFAASPADAAKKKKKPACAAYTPTEWGTGQPINVVTDKHTAEAPLVLELETAEGLGSSSPNPPEEDPTNPITRVFSNVQVDSGAPGSGLYATLEYQFPLDYDLYVRGDDGTGLAYSAGFAPGVPFLDGTGNGGETGQGTENILGLTTADCTGYLVDVISAATPGGAVTLKLWLGEPAYAPGG